MKLDEINIRDPYILPAEGKYYMYGTRSASAWGRGDGFDCYVSGDLAAWEGPKEVFRRPEGFFADRNYWAPECIAYKGSYYLITTFANSDIRKGIYILKADHPEGPFTLYSERLTPEDWTCIDGTVYADEGKVYLIYSHSFEDSPTGDMCCQELAPDLTHAISEPVLLFSAPDAPWPHPVPFAKAEFGMDGDVYFTDGPFLFKKDGTLYMTWSSWGTNGYAVGLAHSDNGKVIGNWIHHETPFFPENGGHGMAFTDKDGHLRYALHYPNDKFHEHPMFIDLTVIKQII